MNKDEVQLLRDPLVEPTNEIIAQGIGQAYPVYETFLKELKNQDITLMNWRFYNDGKAWLSKGEYHWTTIRGTDKKKPIFWLSIWKGFFKVSFIFAEKTKEKLLNLTLSKQTKDMIKNTVSNGEKMKYISVILDITKEDQLEDVFILSQFRKENI